jgi:hypothetical protein
MKLIFVEGAFVGRQEILKPVGSVIGRVSTADIHLDDQTISRQHCRISRVEGQWLIEDLGSINGIMVNGTRVQGSMALQPGDRISILQTVMLFTDETGAEPAPGNIGRFSDPITTPAETSQPARMPLTEPPLNVAPAIAAAPGAIPEPAEPNAAPRLSLPRRPPPLPQSASATGMPRPANATVGHSPTPRPLPVAAIVPPPQVHIEDLTDSTSLAPTPAAEPPSNDDSRSQLWMRLVLIVVVLALAALLVVVLKQPSAPSGTLPGGGGTVNILTPPGSDPATHTAVPVSDQVLLVPIPENGEILLEGTKPITAPGLVPGKNSTVVIRKPGYKDIQIQMGTGKMPALVFQPKPMSVLVTSAPSGAAIYKGSEFLGRTPCVIGNLPLGSYTLMVGGQDTRPTPLTITISPRSGTTNTYHVPLTKMPASAP